MKECLKRAQANYAKNACKQINLKIHKKKHANILSKLESVDSMQSYIIGLIRRDISDPEFNSCINCKHCVDMGNRKLCEKKNVILLCNEFEEKEELTNERS